MNIRGCVAQGEEGEEKRTNAFPPSRQRYRDRAKKLQRESLYVPSSSTYLSGAQREVGRNEGN